MSWHDLLDENEMTLCQRGVVGLYSVITTRRHPPPLDGLGHGIRNVGRAAIASPAGVDRKRAEAAEAEPNLLLAVLYIGIFAAFIAFLAWNEGIRRVGPTRAMAFYNMLPVYDGRWARSS